MLLYSLQRREKQIIKNSSAIKTKKQNNKKNPGRVMVLSDSAVCGSKKSRFIKEKVEY